MDRGWVQRLGKVPPWRQTLFFAALSGGFFQPFIISLLLVRLPFFR